jgi:hypothetical protein
MKKTLREWTRQQPGISRKLAERLRKELGLGIKVGTYWLLSETEWNFLTKHTRKNRMKAQNEKMRAMLKEGYTLEIIADYFNLHKNTIKRRLKNG